MKSNGASKDAAELDCLGVSPPHPVPGCSCSGGSCPPAALLEVPPQSSSPTSTQTSHGRTFRDSDCSSSLGLSLRATSPQKCSVGSVWARVSPQVWRGYLQRKRTQQDRQMEMEFIGMVSASWPRGGAGQCLGRPLISALCAPPQSTALSSPSLPATQDCGGQDAGRQADTRGP